MGAWGAHRRAVSKDCARDWKVTLPRTHLEWHTLVLLDNKLHLAPILAQDDGTMSQISNIHARGLGLKRDASWLAPSIAPFDELRI